MELTVNQVTVTVDTLPREQSIQEYINTKATAAGREVCVLPACIASAYRFIEHYIKFNN